MKIGIYSQTANEPRANSCVLFKVNGSSIEIGVDTGEHVRYIYIADDAEKQGELCSCNMTVADIAELVLPNIPGTKLKNVHTLTREEMDRKIIETLRLIITKDVDARLIGEDYDTSQVPF